MTSLEVVPDTIGSLNTTGLAVAVVGNGGRESELGRQMALSDDVEIIYFLNGNAGTSELPGGENVPISPADGDNIVAFIQEHQPELTIIGPEAPLVSGVTDRLRASGMLVFGPSAEAAQLEASKAYSTEFMKENDIPQPYSVVVDNYGTALTIIGGISPDNYVIKADGLAGGKGVVLPKTIQEAKDTLRGMFLEGGYDGAGKDRVVIQERLHGPEVSVFVVSDGERFTILPFAQDHKRLLAGDKGPNTGGMGAYAPLPEGMVTTVQALKIQDIAERSITGMARRGVPYQGVLYMGLMLAEERGGDPVVIEYNARFGDPETQVVLPVLSAAGVDVYDLLRSSAEGHLNTPSLPTQLGSAALTVCLAARGYPENPEKGQPVHGLETPYDGVIIHHAGTTRNGDVVETAGGRALYVTGIGETVDEAAARAYRAIGRVGFDGMQYRDDIGHLVRSTS